MPYFSTGNKINRLPGIDHRLYSQLVLFYISTDKWSYVFLVIVVFLPFKRCLVDEAMVALFLLVLMIIAHNTSEARIDIHPSEIIREPGQAFSIECNSSSPNATVQLTLPNSTIVNFTDRFVLVVKNVISNDSGVYECSVSGESAAANVYIC